MKKLTPNQFSVIRLDRTNWFNDLETKANMNSFAIGIIKEIMGERYMASYAKVAEIACTLRDLEGAWDAKRALLQTDESLLELLHLEQILGEG